MLLKVRQEPALMFLVGLAVVLVPFLFLQLMNDPEIFFATTMRSLGLGSTYAIVFTHLQAGDEHSDVREEQLREVEELVSATLPMPTDDHIFFHGVVHRPLYLGLSC